MNNGMVMEHIIVGANYNKPVTNITRHMVVTNSATGDAPTIWGSGEVSALGELEIAGIWTKWRTAQCRFGTNSRTKLECRNK